MTGVGGLNEAHSVLAASIVSCFVFRPEAFGKDFVERLGGGDGLDVVVGFEFAIDHGPVELSDSLFKMSL